MLTHYIYQKLTCAQYKILDDGSYFGKIPGCDGVWASEKTLEQCRETLREILEEWIILKLQDGDKLPGMRVSTNTETRISTRIIQHA